MSKQQNKKNKKIKKQNIEDVWNKEIDDVFNSEYFKRLKKVGEIEAQKNYKMVQENEYDK